MFAQFPHPLKVKLRGQYNSPCLTPTDDPYRIQPERRMKLAAGGECQSEETDAEDSQRTCLGNLGAGEQDETSNLTGIVDARW